jgi:hypothetical protein
VYFIPLFGEMKIPKTEMGEMCIFGFENYEQYQKRYLEISVFPKYRILILEDFFSFPSIQDPLLTSLFLLHFSFENIVILQNHTILQKNICIFHFIKNGIFYGKSKENVNMEWDGYDLIEKKIIDSKIGKMDVEDIWIFKSLDLNIFFEKYKIDITNVNQIQLWKNKNVFRHYLYFLILQKRIHLYFLDGFSEKELEIFQKDLQIPFS